MHTYACTHCSESLYEILIEAARWIITLHGSVPACVSSNTTAATNKHVCQ